MRKVDGIAARRGGQSGGDAGIAQIKVSSGRF